MSSYSSFLLDDYSCLTGRLLAYIQDEKNKDRFENFDHPASPKSTSPVPASSVPPSPVPAWASPPPRDC